MTSVQPETMPDHETGESLLQPTDPIEVMEARLEGPLTGLTEEWQGVYSDYRYTITDGISEAAKVVYQLSSGELEWDNKPIIPKGARYRSLDKRELKRHVDRLGSAYKTIICTEAMVCARLRAIGATKPDQYPGLEDRAAKYLEIKDEGSDKGKKKPVNADMFVEFSFDPIYDVTKKLHSSLFERFKTIEPLSDTVTGVIETALQQDEETRLAVIEWIGTQDPSRPQDRTLLRTLASYYEAAPERLEAVFIAPEEPSTFVIDLMILKEDGEVEQPITSTANSIRAILARNGIETDDASDAELLSQCWPDLTPQVTKLLKSGSSDLYQYLLQEVKAKLDPHKDRMYRIPAETDIDNLKRQRTGSNAPRQRGGKRKPGRSGRTTQSPNKGILVTSDDVEVDKPPSYTFARLVKDVSGLSGWILVDMDPDSISSWVEKVAASANKGDASLIADLTETLNYILTDPYAPGTETAPTLKHKVLLDNGRRATIATRTFGPRRTSEIDITSTRGQDIRVIYGVQDGVVCLRGIYMDHQDYVRTLHGNVKKK